MAKFLLVTVKCKLIHHPSCAWVQYERPPAQCAFLKRIGSSSPSWASHVKLFL